MDVLAELRAALERFAEFRRRPRKQKKVKVANRRPAKMGASAGCGTGAGGFKAGNNCAAEDGIPRKPLSQGGALKGANAKGDLARAKAMREKAAAKKAKKEAADKAKSAATRPQREAKSKAKKIDYLRRKAAERKAQKGERDAAEKQAAAEAAAAKKAAMLQKIRIKKANEQLKVAGTPKSIKQELEELKLQKASESLKVVSAPSIRKELDALKARLAAEKKAEAAVKKAEKEPEKPPVEVGKPLLTKKNETTPEIEAALEKDRELVFGEHLKAGWGYTLGANSDKVRSDQKRIISHNAAKALDKMGIKESDIDDDIFKTMRLGDYLGAASAEQLVKAGIPESLHRRYALSAAMVSSWAATSSKGPLAIGIQYAIMDSLKVKRAHTRNLLNQLKETPGWQQPVDAIRKHKAVQAVIKAHHDATQADFKSKGITHLTLARGYKSASKLTATGERDVPLQPASSFTMKKSTAEVFAGGGKTARFLTVTVPARRVLSMCTTGFGCMHEQEIVILGGVVRGRLVGSTFKW
jgi:hypothetical protein